MTSNDEILFLTLAEAAAQLRLSRNTIYKLCRSGELPAVKVGRQWRIRSRDFATWLDNSRATSNTRPGAGADRLARRT